MQVEKSLLFKAKDKTAITFFVLNLLFGIWICLATSQNPLNADIQTLWLVSITCSLLALNWFARKEDLMYASLAIIPIVLRALLTSSIFTSWSSIFKNLSLILWIIGVWVIVAFAEESYRAAITTFAQTIVKNIKLKVVKQYKMIFVDGIAVGSWLIFHFVQRSFDWLYFLWLIVAGVILQIILRKGGLGAAVLAHLVINLTA